MKSKELWELACEAQMNLVFEHCTHSPQGTNGQTIKHWVKPPEFPKKYELDETIEALKSMHFLSEYTAWIYKIILQGIKSPNILDSYPNDIRDMPQYFKKNVYVPLI